MKLRLTFLVAIVLVVMSSTTSCVRKYICHCDISYSGQPGLPDSIAKEYDITDTKAKAKSTCTGTSVKNVNNGDTTRENCYLY